MNNKKILIIILLGTILLGALFFYPKTVHAIYKPFGGLILTTIPIPFSIPPAYWVTMGPPSGGIFTFITGVSQSLSGRYPPIPSFFTLGISLGGIILYLW
ncbi:MAG: hypothetical protein ISS88_03380 [Candidatus Portnoybacteria bacterium]|nr:hypothetical protein [Candidatus Portnoybacteria bacterium]